MQIGERRNGIMQSRGSDNVSRPPLAVEEVKGWPVAS